MSKFEFLKRWIGSIFSQFVFYSGILTILLMHVLAALLVFIYLEQKTAAGFLMLTVLSFMMCEWLFLLFFDFNSDIIGDYGIMVFGNGPDFTMSRYREIVNLITTKDDNYYLILAWMVATGILKDNDLKQLRIDLARSDKLECLEGNLDKLLHACLKSEFV